MKPVLFHLFGEPVYSYPLLMGMGWGFGFNHAKQSWLNANKDQRTFNILFIGSFLMAWIGAKTFFLVFSSPDKIIEYGSALNFWVGGGFVFYGGLIFALVYLALMSALLKKFFLIEMAHFVPGLLLAHAIGRIGCVMAGCCFGKQCPLDFIDHYPVQLFESLGLFILYGFSNRLIRERKKPLVILTYLWGYGGLRFALEFLRGDAIRGLYYGLSTSQWVSLVLIAAGSFFFLFYIRRFRLFGRRL